MKNILFVCMGNICRSPLAEGLVRARIEREGLDIALDSAGTEPYHVGQPPDRRAIEVAARCGVDIGHLRARQVEAADFDRFDLVLAADRANLAALRSRDRNADRAGMALLLEWCGLGAGRELPDPYYGGPQEFDAVCDLLQQAAEGLVTRIRSGR